MVFVVVAVTCDGRCRYKTLGEELAAGGRIDDVQTMFAHCELVEAPCRDSPRCCCCWSLWVDCCRFSLAATYVCMCMLQYTRFGGGVGRIGAVCFSDV